ncbi:hypothetical protein [Dyella sp. AtDHG13]|uniref:hypothetical protein n=1 Tax=Dyella sp. AtDHG13 TaxID=1938897 RepID=UPI0011B7A24A|nr:hypothetical protein [Dyella sp. AtDHG13]
MQVECLPESGLVVAAFPHHLAHRWVDKQLVPCLPLGLLKVDASVIEVRLAFSLGERLALTLDAQPNAMELRVRVYDVLLFGMYCSEAERHDEKDQISKSHVSSPEL